MPPTPRKRATQIEKQEYLLAVHYYLDRGYETQHIVQALMRQFGFECDRHPKRYISAAKAERSLGLSSQTRQALLGDTLFKADFLYRQALLKDEPDYKLAEQALSLRCQVIRQLPEGGNIEDDKPDAPSKDVLGNALERVLIHVEEPAEKRNPQPE